MFPPIKAEGPVTDWVLTAERISPIPPVPRLVTTKMLLGREETHLVLGLKQTPLGRPLQNLLLAPYKL